MYVACKDVLTIGLATWNAGHRARTVASVQARPRGEGQWSKRERKRDGQRRETGRREQKERGRESEGVRARV